MCEKMTVIVMKMTEMTAVQWIPGGLTDIKMTRDVQRTTRWDKVTLLRWTWLVLPQVSIMFTVYVLYASNYIVF